MIKKSESIDSTDPMLSSGNHLNDQPMNDGPGALTDDRRSKLLDQLNHLEAVKLKAIEMGHQDMATSVSKQQREIRATLQDASSYKS